MPDGRRVSLGEHGYEFDDDPIEDDDSFYADCGLGPDGQCSKAGSEECDFECGAAYEKVVEKKR